ncbi:MFS transporter [Thermoanaerobacterium sp. RBIITD]|uniref:MFS transporter n=1 Tax=Thermoanaerobacterium sp. RBIITD TaxID=1550240 RepID=UPI000BB87712|nr:MFS transporter [Thermoanaerobacterium sp. RBIITD]SNX53917.1 MFS transporter, UMF1 family [Thermoanaerobacterium sp. RBIITD]
MDSNKKEVFSWVMYDWANSAFATTICAAVFPIFYHDVAAGNLPGSVASAYWGFTAGISMLVLIILSPIIGTLADYSYSKKKYLITLALLGIISTGFFMMVNKGQYLLASAIYIIAVIGFAGGNVFYDSFLPDIVDEEERNYVSSKGFAFGYLGGGLLLAINILMIQFPKFFFIHDTLEATKLSFLSVSIWWFIFSLPIFINLKERKPAKIEKHHFSKLIIGSFNRLGNTFLNIMKYKELFKFLIAFWLYNDAIGTIIAMATTYGRDIGINQVSLMGALLLTQFAGFPFTMIFGKYANRWGTKNSIYICLFIYGLICIGGFFMKNALHFWILAFAVSMVQGGSQALSRSLFSNLVPKERTAEFFGFYSIFNKLSDWMGPMIFGFASLFTGNSRFGIFSLIFFIILGAIVLYFVDVENEKEVNLEMVVE